MTPAEAYRRTVALIRAGRTIDAIKLARQEYGLTLKEAKDLVEAIMETTTC